VFNVSHCGAAPKYDHASPSNAADARETKYVSGEGQVEVNFVAGDRIEYKCDHGFSTNGSPDGNKTFMVNCSEFGYFKPGGVCVKESKCGTIPNVSHAMPTGKSKHDGSVEMVCAHGYSLDGEKAPPGGLGKNTVFYLKCSDWSGEYEEFKGECKPFAFIPTNQIINMYNKVFNALFVVDCKGTLKNAFGQLKGPPSTLDSACGKIKDGAIAGECTGLVSTFKTEFEAKEKELKDHIKKNEEEGKVFNMSHPDKDRPSIDEEADTMCTSLWKLLELPKKDEMPSGVGADKKK
jgi:hypothetical protein